jgi:thymidylate synthase (FAD)
VRVVDYMGDDAAVVQAARVSYGTGTRKINEDRGLIRYLMRHRHTTPFEMCELKLHVKLPIFVARQWIRHRTANVNEYSARYSVLDREFYLPRAEDLNVHSASNKQGRGDTLSEEAAAEVLRLLRRDASQCYDTYEHLLDDPGLARELARMNLPVNYYTQWYWKVDLHNLLHFLALRIDPHAQYEIRVYGEAMADLVKAWVPMVWEAFEDYRLHAVTFSKQMMDVLRAMLAGRTVTREESGLSKREWDELMEVLAR